MTRFCIIVILFMISLSSCKKEIKDVVILPKKTILKGCVIGRDSDTILLVKSTGDARSETIASIPIKNWEFTYEFEPAVIEAYELVFKEEHDDGGWMPIRFFSESDTIHLVLNSIDDFEKNQVIGGKLNAYHNVFKKEISKSYSDDLNDVYKIFDSISYDSVHSEDYAKILQKLQEAETQEERVVLYKAMDDFKKNDLHRSAFGKQIDSQVAEVQNEYWAKKYTYIKNNPTIVSYSLLLDDIMGLDYNNAPKEKIILALNDLQDVFPDHPYTELAQNLWIGYTELQPGGQYINFTAPDINGIPHELKPVVEKNEIVLLDLWATWCGPCIARSRLMRPVYENYKNKGFDILGVAGENKNLDAYKNFMAKEQWPWKNLIELDKQNRIWEKYNVMNGGGGMFLIDSSGEILAVDPSAEEV